MLLTPTGGDCSSKFAITTDHSNHAPYIWIRYSAPTDRNYAIMAEGNCEFNGILNSADQHILYINHCLQPQMMKFYDSMRTGDVPSNTKESIATLLK